MLYNMLFNQLIILVHTITIELAQLKTFHSRWANSFIFPSPLEGVSIEGSLAALISLS